MKHLTSNLLSTGLGLQNQPNSLLCWEYLLAISALLFGLLSLMGWWFDIGVFKSVLPGLVSMKPNTAVSLILCSFSLLILATTKQRTWRLITAICAILVMIIGLVTIAEYQFNWHIARFDQWLFSEPAGMSFTNSPGRMALISALMCSSMGLALLLASLQKAWRQAQWLALFTIVCALTPLIGYMFGYLWLFKLAGSSGVAVHTTLGFLACASALLLISAPYGFMPLLQSRAKPISLSIALLAFALSIAALLHNDAQSRQAIRQVEQTYSVLAEIQNIANTLKEYQLVSGAYLQGKATNWQQQTKPLQQQLRQDLNKLRQILSESNLQHAAIDSLSQQLNAFINNTNSLLSPQDANATERPNARLYQLQSIIASQIELAIAEEKHILKSQQANAKLKAGIANVTLILMLCIGITLLLIILSKLRREVGLRQTAEQKLRAILDASPIAQKLSDDQGVIHYINPAFNKLTGYQLHDIPTLSQWWPLAYPGLNDRQQTIHLWQQHLNSSKQEPQTMEVKICCKDGSIKILEALDVPLSGSLAGNNLTTFVDITERKHTEAKLSLAASVFTHAREGILITDRNAYIIDINQTFSEITGFSREEVIGQNARILQSGKQSKEFYSQMWQHLIDKGHWYGELWDCRKNGELYAELITISAVYDANGDISHYVGLFTDITPMKLHQQQLEHIAHFDALTSLPNRILLSDRLQQALARSQRNQCSLAVAYLDLDGFKAVNDQHGHEIGDQLLIQVSSRMKDALREGDTLARIGGDEFVALLVDLDDVRDYESVLCRLLNAAATPIRINQLLLNVSSSIGVSLSPQDGTEADQLIRQADQSMYLAKQAGKNRYHLFDKALDQQLKSQHSILDNIRQALTQNQFVLYFQPKVVLHTGEVVGVEALIRWQHPTQDILLPKSFLPAIQDHPLSVELGNWVINAALIQMEAWHAIGLDMPVSVNIGARQLQQINFVGQLANVFEQHPNILPNQLELEILESSALEDLKLSTDVMHACRELGVRFALDDFGTGYSSLTYLRHLPVDCIKIDQSFVRDMLSDIEDHHIVKAVIDLADTFEHHVIAEGVETIEQGSALIKLGCKYAQGYAIAKPMKGKEIPHWMETWRPEAAWVIH